MVVDPLSGLIRSKRDSETPIASPPYSLLRDPLTLLLHSISLKQHHFKLLPSSSVGSSAWYRLTPYMRRQDRSTRRHMP